MTPERRAGGELRIAGRTLTGTAIRYGDVSPQFRERFEPGAFGEVRAIDLNLQHDRAVVLMRGATLSDSPVALSVRATLPIVRDGTGALALVRRRVLNGLSIEFNSLAQRMDGGIRVIERAELTGLALVDRGAYPGSTVEIRARGGRGGRLGTFRGSVPTRKRLSCRCAPGNCTEALFDDGAFDGVPGKDEVLAVVGDYANAIASKRRGGVRFWKGRDGSLEYAIDVPNTERGKALMETFETVPMIARPVIDADASQVAVAEGLATYQRAEVRAMTIGATDASEGWPALRRRRGEDDDLPRGESRRARLWL